MEIRKSFLIAVLCNSNQTTEIFFKVLAIRKERDTNDSVKEQVVCLFKMRSHYVRLSQHCLQVVLLAFRQFSETNLENFHSSNSFVFKGAFSLTVFRLLVLAMDCSRKHGQF